MSEEAKTDNLEEAQTPSEEGQASAEASQAESTGDEGQVESPSTPEAPSAPEGQAQSTQPKYGKFGDDPDKVYQSYLELEKHVGNLSELKQKAQLADQLSPLLENLENKEVRKFLNLPVEEEAKEPNIDEMDPKEAVRYLAMQEAKQLVKPLQEKLEFISKDYTQSKVRATIENVRKQFSDFDEHSQEIFNYIDKHPGRVMDNDEALIEVYKIVTYDKAGERGAQKAIEKQKKKREISMGSIGSQAAVKAEPKSYREAIRQAMRGSS